MPRVVHFEIPYDDGARAKAFYEQVFGWKIEGWGAEPTYHLASTGEEGEAGIGGALYQRPERDLGILIYVDVPSVDDYVARGEGAGATVVQAKQPIVGVGWSAILRDPDGSLIGLFQSDAFVSG